MSSEYSNEDSAGITQLVECNLAKVDVASSSLVSRSNGALAKRLCSGLQIRLVQSDSGTRLHQMCQCPSGEIGRHKGFKIPRNLYFRASSILASGTIWIFQWFLKKIFILWQSKNYYNLNITPKCFSNYHPFLFYLIILFTVLYLTPGYSGISDIQIFVIASDKDVKNERRWRYSKYITTEFHLKGNSSNKKIIAVEFQQKRK